MKKDYACRPEQGGPLQAESKTLFTGPPTFFDPDGGWSKTGGGEMTVGATGDILWIAQNKPGNDGAR